MPQGGIVALSVNQALFVPRRLVQMISQTLRNGCFPGEFIF